MHSAQHPSKCHMQELRLGGNLTGTAMPRPSVDAHFRYVPIKSSSIKPKVSHFSRKINKMTSNASRNSCWKARYSIMFIRVCHKCHFSSTFLMSSIHFVTFCARENMFSDATDKLIRNQFTIGVKIWKTWISKFVGFVLLYLHTKHVFSRTKLMHLITTVNK